MVEFNGRQYEIARASDVINDGMCLELNDVTTGARELVLDVYHSDATGEMAVSAHREDLPLELVEWFLAEARRRLPVVPSAAALRELLTEHETTNFPDGFRGVSVAGVDLVMLDADVAGLVQTYAEHGMLGHAQRMILTGCAAEAGRVVPLLPPEARAYFAQVERLARATLNELPEPAA